MKKRVLITGASKGIGRSTAQKLIASGYEVIGTCRNPDKINDAIDGVQYIPLDLSCEESIQKCAELSERVDILINNAGQSQLGSAEDTTVQDYKEMFQVNFFGLVQLTSLIIPQMRMRRQGLIINIGSLIASFPIAYYTSYASSKAATQVYSYALSMELKPFNINVAVLEPNDIKTSIWPKFTGNADGAYAAYTNHLQNRVNDFMADAKSPEIIANKVMDIISSKKVALYYSVGFKSKMLLFMKRFVKQGFVNKNVYKQYGFANIG